VVSGSDWKRSQSLAGAEVGAAGGGGGSEIDSLMMLERFSGRVSSSRGSPEDEGAVELRLAAAALSGGDDLGRRGPELRDFLSLLLPERFGMARTLP